MSHSRDRAQHRLKVFSESESQTVKSLLQCLLVDWKKKVNGRGPFRQGPPNPSPFPLLDGVSSVDDVTPVQDHHVPPQLLVALPGDP
jgi:hypothetical protein